MSIPNINTFDPFESLNIFYDNEFGSDEIVDVSGAGVPAVETGYPLANLDGRSVNQVTRLTGDGTVGSPIIAEIDLGADANIEGVAILNCNVSADKSVILEGGRETDYSDAWTHFLPCRKNLLANGGSELMSGSTWTTSEPSLGVTNVAGTVVTGSAYAAWMKHLFPDPATDPATWDSKNNLGPPNNPTEYPNRWFQRIKANSGHYAFARTPWMKTLDAGKTFKLQVYMRSGVPDTAQSVTVYLASTNEALAVQESVNEVVSCPANNSWTKVELEITLTASSATSTRLAIVMASGSTPTIWDIDDAIIWDASLDTQPIAGFIDNGFEPYRHVVLPYKDRMIRYLRFTFVNDGGDGYIRIGKILIGKILQLSLEQSAEQRFKNGITVDLNQDSQAYKRQSKGARTIYPFKFRGFTEGVINSLSDFLQAIEGDPLFFSLYSQNENRRAAYGHFLESYQSRDDRLPDNFTLTTQFQKEK